MRYFLPLLFMAGCCAEPQQLETRTYTNVVAIEYREDGSLVITYESGRVTVVRNGKEIEDF